MELIEETGHGDNPHLGVGFRTFLYRSTTSPNVRVLVLFQPPPTEAYTGTGYVREIGTIDPTAQREIQWHVFSGGQPLAQCSEER